MSEEEIIKMENNDIERKTQILQHLQNKYDESFEIIGKLGQSMGLPGDLWGVRAIGSDEAFTVTGNVTPDGYIIKDSYYRIYILPEYEKYIKKIIYRQFGECRIEIELMQYNSYPDMLTKDIGVNKIHTVVNEEEQFKSKVTIYIDHATLYEKSVKELAAQVCNEITGNKLSVWMTYHVISDQKSIDTFVYFSDEYYHAKQKNKAFAHKGIPMITHDTEQHEQSVWQLERLCCLVYLDSLTNNSKMGNLYEILSFMLGFGYDDSKICGRLPNDLTKEEWDAVIIDVLKDSYLGHLRLIKYVDINEKTKVDAHVLPGYKAVCFMDEENRAIVVFRGTYGDDEWNDNAVGMYISDTKQQIAAAEFVKELREDQELGIKEMIVTGHSKGGNKAQYVTIALPEGYVDRCVSVNGQGFSKQFMEKYRDEIVLRKDRITLIAERRDFVNSLGLYLKDTEYYAGRRGEFSYRFPYGQPLAYFHYPDALRKQNGEIGDRSIRGAVANAVNLVVVKFLTEERFDEIREETVNSLIALMMTNKLVTSDEIAEAIKNLMLLLFEMLSDQAVFDQCIPPLIYEESDVLIATIKTFMSEETLCDELADTEEVSKIVRNKIALSFMSYPKNLNYFGSFLKNTIKFLRNLKDEVVTNPDVIDYLYLFINSILKYMKENSSTAGKMLASKMERSFLKLRLDVYDKTHEELFNMGIESANKPNMEKFDEDDLIEYIEFSMKALKEMNPTKEEVLEKKLFVAEKTIRLINDIFGRTLSEYFRDMGNVDKIRNLWEKGNQCIKVSMFLCTLLEEEELYTSGDYLNCPSFTDVYAALLERTAFFASNMTAKAVFVYHMYKDGYDSHEINKIKNEVDVLSPRIRKIRYQYYKAYKEVEKYENKREGKEYWEAHQKELSEEVLRKTCGFHILIKEKAFFVDEEKKLRALCKEYGNVISNDIFISIKSKKRKEVESMIDELYDKIYICNICVYELEQKIEKLREVIEDLNSYQQ